MRIIALTVTLAALPLQAPPGVRPVQNHSHLYARRRWRLGLHRS